MQLHDFNPGIEPSGLLWTVPIGPDDITWDPLTWRASYRVDDLRVRDFHDVANGLIPGPSDPAVVSFRMTWTPTTKPADTKDASHDVRFAYRYVMADVRIWARATAPGFHFETDPIEHSTSSYGAVGYEWNGEFFASAP